MKALQPIRYFLDATAEPLLGNFLRQAPEHFSHTAPDSADVIIFGSDKLDYLKASTLFQQYRRKCICVSDADLPTYRLPGLYASNARSIRTSRRALTTSYFLAEANRPNLEIAQAASRTWPKQYLYSFLGGSTSWTRKMLFRMAPSRNDVIIEATDQYRHWEDGSFEQQKSFRERYARIMASSKFALCPRGAGTSSFRLFEAMSLGVAPVIISDRWVPIGGIDWSFALFVPERRLRHLDRIVRNYEGEFEARGIEARRIYQDRLAKTNVHAWTHSQIVDLIAAYDPRREAMLDILFPAMDAVMTLERGVYHVLKHATLRFFSITGLPLPIKLNRPLESQIKARGK
jgi:hypothetical protein